MAGSVSANHFSLYGPAEFLSDQKNRRAHMGVNRGSEPVEGIRDGERAKTNPATSCSRLAGLSGHIEVGARDQASQRETAFAASAQCSETDGNAL